MMQEDKNLLLKDLCARLPYGVKVNIPDLIFSSKNNIEILKEIFCGDDGEFRCNDSGMLIKYVKPYLFPLSSLTEEMLKELNENGFFKYRDDITNVSNIESKNGISKEIYTYIGIENISFLTDYFNSHHIDYRGLIEKGLAINASGLNIYG